MRKLVILLVVLLALPVSRGRSSVEYTGGIQGLAISTSAPDLLTNWTIAAWIYPTIPPNEAGGGAIYSRWTNSTTERQVHLSFTVAGKISVAVPWIAGDIVLGGTSFDADTWYHIVWTRSGNDWTIYVNGISDGTGSSAAVQESGCTFILCRDAATYDQIFTGRVAEVAGWPAVLSLGEIKALAHGTPPNRIRVGLLKSGGYYWPLHTRDTVDRFWPDLGGGGWNAESQGGNDVIANHAPMSPPGGAD